MDFIVTPPVCENGWICFQYSPADSAQIEREAKRLSGSEVSLSFKKHYKKRTLSQLDYVWWIAETMAHDQGGACYGNTKEEIVLGFKFRAIDFGYPTTTINFGGTSRTVPKTISDSGDTNTKEMSILVEVAFLLASENGTDIRKIKRQYGKQYAGGLK